MKEHCPDKAILVEIDPDKLTQVIDNIISNALKYSPEGGKVTFRVKEQEDEVIVSVATKGGNSKREMSIKYLDAFIVLIKQGQESLVEQVLDWQLQRKWLRLMTANLGKKY